MCVHRCMTDCLLRLKYILTEKNTSTKKHRKPIRKVHSIVSKRKLARKTEKSRCGYRYRIWILVWIHSHVTFPRKMLKNMKAKTKKQQQQTELRVRDQALAGNTELVTLLLKCLSLSSWCFKWVLTNLMLEKKPCGGLVTHPEQGVWGLE